MPQTSLTLPNCYSPHFSIQSYFFLPCTVNWQVLLHGKKEIELEVGMRVKDRSKEKGCRANMVKEVVQPSKVADINSSNFVLATLNIFLLAKTQKKFHIFPFLFFPQHHFNSCTHNLPNIQYCFFYISVSLNFNIASNFSQIQKCVLQVPRNAENGGWFLLSLSVF